MVAIADRLREAHPGIVDETLPRPDYAHHPAYGQHFGSPTLTARLQALRKLAPAMREQFLVAWRLKDLPRLDLSTGNTLVERLSRDGAIAVQFDGREIAALRHHVRPYIAQLQERKASVPQRDRVFKDMILPISVKTNPDFIRCLRETLESHGVIDAASRYLGRRAVMREVVRLQITDADDRPWHTHFGDVGVPDPATTYMHVDSEPRFMKGMLYFNEVTRENGPFSYVLGTNHVRMSRFEYMVRKANDRSGLDRCDPDTRRLFNALPRRLQMKSEFGNDLLDGSPEAAVLLSREHQFTSEDGHLIVFDNNGIHRGLKVVAGERHAMQIQLRPLDA